MPLSLPCPQVSRGCDCTLDPVSNYSSEASDHPVFFGQENDPPASGTFFAPSCFGTCESAVSQEVADECAARRAIECSNDGAFPVPRSTFRNSFQTCTVECPDGLPFSWTVDSSTVASAWQADADARAYALACKRAKEHRLCFTTDTPLAPACFGAFYSHGIEVAGGTPPYSFALTSGSLPAGLIFNAVGLVQGTPTGSGTSTFTITVTDDIGSTQVKPYVLHVVKITSPSSLPGGTVSTPYSYTLLTVGTSGTVIWSIASGALPPGLMLSSAGVISGTPVSGGSSTFTLALIDGAGASCSKQFTITIAGTLLSYWRFESFSGDLIPDATPHGFNLTGDSATQLIVAGKVGNAIRMANFDSLSLFDGPFALFNNVALTGFTLCGWFKLAAPDNAGDGNIVNVVQWTVPKSQFFLEIFNADLLLNILAEDFSAPTLTIANPQDSGWHFYRIWFDPSDSRMRFQLDNGSIIVSPAIPFGSGTFSQFVLASNSVFAGGTFRFLDETGFWKRVLSNAEAATLWNSGNGTTYPAVPP